MIVHLDFETRSKADLRTVGVYRYAEDPSTEVLSVAWAVDGGPVKAARVLGAEWPAELIELAENPEAVFSAHNANFERRIWAMQVDLPSVPINRWRCTAAVCGYRGLPLGLDEAASVLGLMERKLSFGGVLLKLISRPQGKRPKIKDPDVLNGREPFQPEVDENGFVVLDDLLWGVLLDYNRQDVEVERALGEALWELPPAEQATWELDQEINDRGIAVDLELVRAMLDVRKVAYEASASEFRRMTGLKDPTPRAFTAWLAARVGDVGSVSRGALDVIKARADVPEYVKRAIDLYSELSITSTAKLSRLLDCVCRDGRIRGMFQYHGATTGRWAGRLVQPQNLPRPSKDHDVGQLVDAIMTRDLDTIEMVSGVSAMKAVKDAMRNVFVAGPGRVLCSVDFASIEARVLAWLAGEQWKIDLFASGGDPYIAAAERIYPDKKGQIDKKSPERQKGKIAELALGYQGWIGAYYKMASANPPPEDEVEKICQAWRDAHPRIVAFWRGLEAAAFHAVADNVTTKYRGISYWVKKFRGRRWLVCSLPNGKRLHYYDPEIRSSSRDAWRGQNRLALTYMGYKQTPTGGRQWRRVELYGGLLAENVVQAVSREILVEALKKAAAAGYEIVLHVHDEITAEARVGDRLADHRILANIMREPAPWRSGLPIGAEGWTAPRYQK